MHIQKLLVLILSLCLIATYTCACAHNPEPEMPATAATATAPEADATPENATPEDATPEAEATQPEPSTSPEKPSISPEEQARIDEEAEAAFHALDDQYQTLMSTEIVVDQSGKELQWIAQKLQNLTPLYIDILAKYKSPTWAIASCHNLGRMYQHISEGLLNSPSPKDLPEEVETAYREAITYFADKFKEQVIIYYTRAVEISDSNGINTEYSENARKYLENLSK